MADIGYPELAEGIGIQTGDSLVDIANTAADFLCDAYQNAADAIIGGPLDNPGARFADGLARRICAPRNKTPPNPPAPPFTGGQCPVFYVVDSGYLDNGVLKGVSSGFVYRGPIGPTYILAGAGDSKVGGFYSRDANGGLVRNDVFSAGSNIVAENNFTPVILSVTRQDGLSDDCGNIGPTYESRLPKIPDLKGTRPWPIPGVNIPVDIEITPVKFEPGINIKPEFNINVGGIQVRFDITGAKVNIGPQFNFPPQLPPGLDPRVPPPSPEAIKDIGESVDEINDKLDDVLDELEDIKKCACKSLPPFALQFLAESDGGVYTLPDRCKLVRISMAVESQNPKVEFGNGEAPDVYYWGWYSFNTPGGFTERKGLNWKTQSVEVPSFAQQFSFTARKGYIANVVAYLEPPDE